MKRILSVLVILCLLVSCSACSAKKPKWEGFRGLQWGASKEEIIKAEGRDPDYYTPEFRVESGETMVLVEYQNESVSKYKDCAYVNYNLLNDHLVFSRYIVPSDNPDSDYAYLKKALTDTYGEPSGQGLELISRLFDFVGGSTAELVNPVLWAVDDTVVILYVNSSNVHVFYYGKDYFEQNKFADGAPETVDNAGL